MHARTKKRGVSVQGVQGVARKHRLCITTCIFSGVTCSRGNEVIETKRLSDGLSVVYIVVCGVHGGLATATWLGTTMDIGPSHAATVFNSH